jgi:hypothetical protein
MTISHPVSFDNRHVVTVNPEKERSKGRGIDDTETVCFSRDEW